MSLTKEVVKLYKMGMIRDEAMNVAIKEASAVRNNARMEKVARTIALRAKLLGAMTPSMQKIAGAEVKGPLGIVETLTRRGGALGAILATAAGVSALGGVAKKYMDNRAFEDTYTSMMIRNPEFKANKAAVKEHFEVLKQFAPAMAKNPTVAAGYIQQATEMGNIVPADTIHKLTQTQKSYSDAQPGGIMSQALESIAGGAKDIITSGIMLSDAE